MNEPLLAFAGLAALCGICQWLAWRFLLPSILFLLTAGMLVGPVFGLFDPDAFLGDLLFPFVSIAVAIILFEGGLTLKVADIRGHGSVVTRLITIGVLISWGLLTIATHYIFDMSWSLALVFGSIVVVSGPTVVKPLLRSVRPSDKVGHILNWEGILIDPVGVFLALLVFDFVLLDQAEGGASGGYGHIALILLKLVAIGSATGIAAGWATAYALRRYLIPDYLVNVVTLVIVVCVFTLSETLQHESGLLAVTIMGVWLANKKGLHVEELLHFKEDLSVLLISGLFIVLASRIDIAIIPQYGWQILLLLAVAQFIVRPLNAWVCTIGADLSFGERAFIAWISPRGIVAAAVSSLFVLRLEEVGMPMAELLVPLVFSMIIGTVVFQSLTAKPLAKRLGISNPEPNGVLFFGANDMAIALATALRTESIRVMLSDTSWRNVRRARRAGLEAYHGNPTSGHATENLNLQGIGKLIAVSDSSDTNALAGIHFRSTFGSNAVFTLTGASDDDAYERFSTANRNRANPLFESALGQASLARRLREGEIRHLLLKEETATSDDEEEADAPLAAGKAGDVDEAYPDDGSTSPEVLSMKADRTQDERAAPTRPTDVGESPTEATGPVAREAAGEAASEASEKSSLEEAMPRQTSGTTSSSEAFSGAEETTREAVRNDQESSPISEHDLRLFAIDPAGRLYIYGAGESFVPKPGWRVIVLSERDTSRDADTEVTSAPADDGQPAVA